MRAAVVPKYGGPDIIELTDRPTPVPGAGDVLIKVAATAVTSGDSRMRAARFPTGFGVLARAAVGLRGPRAQVLGGCVSGTVDRVGAGVAEFAPGDEVAGMTGVRMGGHAEYVRARVDRLTHKPPAVSHADAAGILFGGTTALYFLERRAGLRAGETVLVNGASGAVGSAAVQLARLAGATVTAVASARNHEFLRRLGAARVIDYRETPVTSLGEKFDVVFDTVGNLSRAEGLRLLTGRGRLALAAADLADTMRARGRVLAGTAPERGEDAARLLELLAAGKLDAVTTVLGGLDAIQEAHRIVDSGRKVANLVVLPHGRCD